MVEVGIKFLGYAMIIGGLYMMYGVVPAMFRVIPYVGVYIESFGNIIAFITAVAIGTVLGSITTTIAWFAARPVKSAFCLVCLGLIALSPYILQAYGIEMPGMSPASAE